MRYNITAPWAVLIFILIRLCLCFQMKQRSPWVLISTISFVLCYAFYAFKEAAIYPITRVLFYLEASIGYGSDFPSFIDVKMRGHKCILQTLTAVVLFLWLTLIPLITGIMQSKLKKIKWNHKWIWSYLAIAFILPTFSGYYEPFFWMFASGCIMALLPLIYWSLYQRNGRSLAAVISNYRPASLYILFILPFFLVLYIGMDSNTFIKTLALLFFPSFFYILFCDTLKYKPLTRHVLALSISGILYIFVFSAPYSFKIYSLSISIALILYVAIDTVIKHHEIWVGISIPIAIMFVINPIILGLNPYKALHTDGIYQYHKSFNTRAGVFIISKNGKYGLRDRLGMMVEPRYSDFSGIDTDGRFIMIIPYNESNNVVRNSAIYDTYARRFLTPADSIKLSATLNQENIQH